MSPQMVAKDENKSRVSALDAVTRSVVVETGEGLLHNKLANIVENPYATGQASVNQVNTNAFP